MGGRFRDFDAAFAERDQGRSEERRQPITIRLYGKRWDLGYDLPAAVVLRLGRLAEDGDLSNVDLKDPKIAGEVMGLAADLIPPKVLKAWTVEGIGVEDLAEVILWVLTQHRFGQPEVDASGEAPAPTEAETSSDGSSNGGGSSSPTSTGSTSSSSTDATAATT